MLLLFLKYLLLYHVLVYGATVTKVEFVQVYIGPISENQASTKIEGYTLSAERVFSSSSKAAPQTPSSISTTQSESTSQGFNASFAESIVKIHNEKRRLHGAQALEWNMTLYQYADDFALKYDCSGALTHSGGKYGENLAIGYTTVGSVNAWYDEGKTYQYGSESTYNHFTALIWNNSNQLGCAYKYCNPVWGTYIICSYYPAGNVVGQCSQNVFPPI